MPSPRPMRFRHTQTILLQQPRRSRHPYSDKAHPVDVNERDFYNIPDCVLVPGANTDERGLRRTQSTTKYQLFIPDNDIIMDPGDIVIDERGISYRVVGIIHSYSPHPFTGWEAPVVYDLERVTG